MKKILLFVWMAVTLASGFTAEAYVVVPCDQEKTTELAEKGEHDPEKEHKEVSFQIDRTVANILQAGFHADLSSEFELPLIIDNGANKARFSWTKVNHYFKTLFYFIISPNAP